MDRGGFYQSGFCAGTDRVFIAYSLESAALDCCRFDGLCRNDDAAFAVVIEVADGLLKL